ncbi:hypothetical protein [Uliginosibacterium sp. H1]|uniref:hypothetical protein n=1 Tax=Uliginosibacterium sp. H1 TaxID=3114757 RepID=UPI002E19EF65|nr:hypothetical protein [Uliginosibacterium sp. H1]
MTMTIPEFELKEADEPNPRAVRMGRGTLIGVGVFLLVIAGVWGHFNPKLNVVFTAFLFGCGFGLIWLGVGLPVKLAAHVGFNLPWFLQ